MKVFKTWKYKIGKMVDWKTHVNKTENSNHGKSFHAH